MYWHSWDAPLQLILTAHDLYRSYHELKSALGVMPAAHYEHHMCPEPHCCKVFPDLPRSEWDKPEHRDFVCPHCHVGRRFKQKTGHSEASKRCVSYPLTHPNLRSWVSKKCEALQNLFTSLALPRMPQDICPSKVTIQPHINVHARTQVLVFWGGAVH
jgi:hypothetical protein